jgi:hypothetical protein
MTVAPLLYGFRSAVTNASWVIDLDIIQPIDCECFSKLGLNGEFTVRRWRARRSAPRCCNHPGAREFQLRRSTITEDSAFEIWGVVTRSIRML